MKTLFLSSVYPSPLFPVRGTFNRMLCHALNEAGEVRVVAPLPWPEVVQGMAKRLTRSPAKRKQQRDSIVAPVDGDSVPVERPVFLYPPKFMRHRYGQFMWSSVRKSVERVTADFRPDWVVSYWAHPDGDAGLAVEGRGDFLPRVSQAPCRGEATEAMRIASGQARHRRRVRPSSVPTPPRPPVRPTP